MSEESNKSSYSNETWQAVIDAHVREVKRESLAWRQFLRWYHQRPEVDGDDYREPGIDAGWGETEEEVADHEFAVTAPYTYSFIDSLVATVAPSNPQAEAVAQLGQLDSEVREVREALLNWTIGRCNMRQKLRTATIWTAITGRCAAVVGWDSKRKRPSVDIVPPTHYFFDHTQPFEESDYIIRMVVKKESEVKRLVKDKIYKLPEHLEYLNSDKYPQWLREIEDSNSDHPRASPTRDPFRWVTLFECHDMRADRLLIFHQDIPTPLFNDALPFEHRRNFHQLVFVEDLQSYKGVSDIAQIAPALRRLNEIDSLTLEHAHASMPLGILNGAVLEDPDQAIAALTEDQVGGWAVINTLQGMSASSAISYTPSPSVPPDFDKMRERLVELITNVLGLPNYARGAVGSGEVATEFALADTERRTRNGVRTACMDNFSAGVYTSMMACWAQFMTPETSPFNIRVDAIENPVEVSFEELDFTEDDNAGRFHYRVVSTSPTENHRMIVLQKLQVYLSVFMQSPNVDQSQLIATMLDLLGLKHLYQEAPPQPQMPAGDPNLGIPPQGQGDTPAGGGMPEGAEADAFLPAESGLMADAPVL
jgi:hypothetical protein